MEKTDSFWALVYKSAVVIEMLLELFSANSKKLFRRHLKSLI
jgi:hypothetical protein